MNQSGSSRAIGAPMPPVEGLPSLRALPMPTRRRGGCEFDLIRDDGTWAFRDADDSPVTRRLRVWRDGTGGLIAVVTEAGTGTCITDAAAEIHQQLTRVEYPSQRVRLFEHWPADTDEGSDEQFDEVLLDGAGEVTWMYIPAGPFASMLGLPPPQESRNPQGRVARHRVFRCFDEGSVMITDPHGGPLGCWKWVPRHGRIRRAGHTGWQRRCSPQPRMTRWPTRSWLRCSRGWSSLNYPPPGGDSVMLRSTGG